MAYFEQNLLRKKEIEEALLKLMHEIPYEQIAVKSLTEQLQLARKTFYHYFPSKYACLESLFDRIIQECDLALMTLPEEAGTAEVCAERLNFWIRHRDFLEVILRNRLEYLLIERIMRHLIREDNSLRIRLSTQDVPCDEDILYYYVSGQIQLILKWCREDFVCPLEEMVRKCLRLTYAPLLPPEEE